MPKKKKVGHQDALIPPSEKLVRGSLPCQGLVLFKEVDYKLIEFFIVKTIVVTHPVRRIVEGEVKLG